MSTVIHAGGHGLVAAPEDRDDDARARGRVDASVGQEVREDLTQGGLVTEDRGIHSFPELPRMVGSDHVGI